ncbi:MAG TPA: phosphomannomutase/phosphoglucomutase [Acidimicrobiales bacterium]|jgi:phosphomannomutase|nr:phosphomannomutase/phosphoglucomutase [Acidimicrobiales bacterium]
MPTSNALSAIFKAYDVRGIVPDQLDAAAAQAIGAGFARFLAGATGSRRPEILLGHDMRTTADSLASAFTAGAVGRGAVVTSLGLASTDLVYYASGKRDAAAVMLTASHNPAQYNGMKFCLPGAKPIGEESGLADVLRYAEEEYGDASTPYETAPTHVLDLLDEFADHVRSFIDGAALRPLVIVADTANGMGGLIAPTVFSKLPVELHVLFGELDGTFPNHPADPLQPENLRDLIAAIAKRKADVGLAFDGDADRVFLVDELGAPIPGSTTTAIVAAAMLERNPGATILYNCICSKTVREVIAERGGVGIRTRVGHSFIKQVMAETGAVFGGEHSGHYYFKENYRADSGIIAALVVLEVLSRFDGPLSELRKPFERYAESGEINTTVDDQETVLDRIEDHYAGVGAIDHLDGLTVDCGSWWFNLRPSNTEPLLRLNVEAHDRAELVRRLAEVGELMRRT